MQVIVKSAPLIRELKHWTAQLKHQGLVTNRVAQSAELRNYIFSTLVWEVYLKHLDSPTTYSTDAYREFKLMSVPDSILNHLHKIMRDVIHLIPDHGTFFTIHSNHVYMEWQNEKFSYRQNPLPKTDTQHVARPAT